MSEISYYDTDLNEAIGELSSIVEKLPKCNHSEKQKQIKAAEKQMKMVLDLKRGYNLALRQLTDKNETRTYKKKLEEHNEKIGTLNNEIKWMKSESGSQRNNLDVENVSMNNQQMLRAAQNIQIKTEKSLGNTQRLINASKDVAKATGERLDDQRKQITQINDDVMRIEDSLTQADRLIRTFSRRMATDRVILCFSFLVFLGIVAIVIYSIVDPNQTTFEVPDEVKPPNPQDFTGTRMLRKLYP